MRLITLHKYHGLGKIYWDASTPSKGPFNTRVSNQKLRNEGFELVHPEIVF